MPASLPPNIKFYTVSNGTETLSELLDFGTVEPITSSIELGPIRTRIYNDLDPQAEETYATALSPLCYIGGTDADIIASTPDEWISIQNIDNNGISVVDEYEKVSNSNIHGYKALAGVDIAPDTYITFDTKLNVPAGTSGGIYDWEYIIEYMYTT